MASPTGYWAEVQRLWKVQNTPYHAGCQCSPVISLLLFSLISHPAICIVEIGPEAGKQHSKCWKTWNLFLVYCWFALKIKALICSSNKLWEFTCKEVWNPSMKGAAEITGKWAWWRITAHCGKESGAAPLYCLRHFTTSKGHSLGPVARDPGVEMLLYSRTVVKFQIILIALLSFLSHFALEKFYWPGKIQFKSQIVSD